MSVITDGALNCNSVQIKIKKWEKPLKKWKTHVGDVFTAIESAGENPTLHCVLSAFSIVNSGEHGVAIEHAPGHTLPRPNSLAAKRLGGMTSPIPFRKVAIGCVLFRRYAVHE
jgi:hypothetical protein